MPLDQTPSPTEMAASSLGSRQVVHRLLGGLLAVAITAILVDARLLRPRDVFTFAENIQIGEAKAWWNGRLDLPERKWDSALFAGKVYSHFPPLFSFLSAAISPAFGSVPHWFVFGFIFLPIPLLSYLLAWKLAPSPLWAAALAIGLVCGSSALPVLELALRGGSPYQINQALAMIGVLIFLCEYFGRQRWWLAGAGIVMAAWSRQMTLAYLIPLAWMIWSAHRVFRPAWKEPGTDDRPFEIRLKRDPNSFAVRFGLIFLLAVGVPMGLNWLKFGSPLESGYMYVYEGRTEDTFARDARTIGLFSVHYVPRNLYYTNLGFPDLHKIMRGEKQEWYLTPNDWGTGIWWTTPLLLFLLWDWRRITSRPGQRWLLLGAAFAYGGLMLYHSTGFVQRGFNRYSLDYLPALVALAIPSTLATTRRMVLTAVIVGWSVLYFACLIHLPQVRIW